MVRNCRSSNGLNSLNSLNPNIDKIQFISHKVQGSSADRVTLSTVCRLVKC